MNLILMGGETLQRLIRGLATPYNTNWFMVEPQLLHGIKADCHTCEVKRLHALHVTMLYCPRVKIENSPHVRGRVENEFHIDRRRNLARVYKRLGYSLYYQLVL